MSYHSDTHNQPRDVGFKPAGVGLTIKAHCMGCGQHRLQTGGKGKPGPRWRCSVCVAAKRVGAA
jgi:hypothetical protein